MRLDQFNVIKKSKSKLIKAVEFCGDNRTILYGFDEKKPHIKHHVYCYDGNIFVYLYDIEQNKRILFKDLGSQINFKDLINYVLRNSKFYPEACYWNSTILLTNLLGSLPFAEFNSTREPNIKFYGRVDQEPAIFDSDERQEKRQETLAEGNRFGGRSRGKKKVATTS